MRTQTPSQTVGPFFHDGLIREGENRLVLADEAGEMITITGQVFDGDGQPVPDALLEIWQADGQGVYPHPADANHDRVDKNFRGYGRSATVEQGRFTFITRKPGRVIGVDGLLQAPHINLRIFARGMLIHAVTRIYFADASSNEDDPVLGLVEVNRRGTLLSQRRQDSHKTYDFDIHLQGDKETVFFNL